MNEDKVLYIDGEKVLSYKFLDDSDIVCIEQGEIGGINKDYVVMDIEHVRQIVSDYDSRIK